MIRVVCDDHEIQVTQTKRYIIEWSTHEERLQVSHIYITRYSLSDLSITLSFVHKHTFEIWGRARGGSCGGIGCQGLRPEVCTDERMSDD